MDIGFLMVQNIFLQKYYKILLIFIPTKKYLRFFNNTSKVYSWKYK